MKAIKESKMENNNKEVYKVVSLSKEGVMKSAMVANTPIALTFELGKKTECTERHFSVFLNKNDALYFMSLSYAGEYNFRLLRGTTTQVFRPEETNTLFIPPSDLREYFVMEAWKESNSVFSCVSDLIERSGYYFELPEGTKFVNDFVPEEVV